MNRLSSNTRRTAFLVGGSLLVILLGTLLTTAWDSFIGTEPPNVVAIVGPGDPSYKPASLTDNWQDSQLGNVIKSYTFSNKGKLEGVYNGDGIVTGETEEFAPNCVVLLGPVKEDKASLVIGSSCTKGDVFDKLLAAGPVVLILYSGTNGTGTQFQLIASDPNGCNAGSYGIPDMSPWGWNGIASSMKAFCSYGFIYDGAGYTPPAFWCSLGLCGSLGSMNNLATASRAANNMVAMYEGDAP